MPGQYTIVNGIRIRSDDSTPEVWTPPPSKPAPPEKSWWENALDTAGDFVTGAAKRLPTYGKELLNAGYYAMHPEAYAMGQDTPYNEYVKSTGVDMDKALAPTNLTQGLGGVAADIGTSIIPLGEAATAGRAVEGAARAAEGVPAAVRSVMARVGRAATNAAGGAATAKLQGHNPLAGAAGATAASELGPIIEQPWTAVRPLVTKAADAATVVSPLTRAVTGGRFDIPKWINAAVDAGEEYVPQSVKDVLSALSARAKSAITGTAVNAAAQGATGNDPFEGGGTAALIGAVAGGGNAQKVPEYGPARPTMTEKLQMARSARERERIMNLPYGQPKSRPSSEEMAGMVSSTPGENLPPHETSFFEPPPEYYTTAGRKSYPDQWDIASMRDLPPGQGSAAPEPYYDPEEMALGDRVKTEVDRLSAGPQTPAKGFPDRSELGAMRDVPPGEGAGQNAFEQLMLRRAQQERERGPQDEEGGPAGEETGEPPALPEETEGEAPPPGPERTARGIAKETGKTFVPGGALSLWNELRPMHKATMADWAANPDAPRPPYASKIGEDLVPFTERVKNEPNPRNLMGRERKLQKSLKESGDIGAASPQMLAHIAAPLGGAAIGAATDPENRTRGAAKGFALGAGASFLPYVSRALESGPSTEPTLELSRMATRAKNADRVMEDFRGLRAAQQERMGGPIPREGDEIGSMISGLGVQPGQMTPASPSHAELLSPEYAHFMTPPREQIRYEEDPAAGAIEAKAPDGTVLGRVRYSNEWTDTPKMEGVEVNPNHQRNGIASELIKRLEARFAGKRIDRGPTTSAAGQAFRAARPFANQPSMTNNEIDDLIRSLQSQTPRITIR